MVTYKGASSEKELNQILALQQDNLPKNLSAAEKQTQGFVMVEHNIHLLRRMNKACPHTLAIVNDKVVGYALSMHPKFGDDIEILKPMFAEIYRVFNGNSFLVMGQICIEKEYGGQGIFRGLYQNMQRITKPEFETIITEVDTQNSRSMQAHKAIGFNELSRFSSGGKEWSLLALE